MASFDLPYHATWLGRFLALGTGAIALRVASLSSGEGMHPEELVASALERPAAGRMHGDGPRTVRDLWRAMGRRTAIRWVAAVGVAVWVGGELGRYIGTVRLENSPDYAR